jgi:hypothetical protein
MFHPSPERAAPAPDKQRIMDTEYSGIVIRTSLFVRLSCYPYFIGGRQISGRSEAMLTQYMTEALDRARYELIDDEQPYN